MANATTQKYAVGDRVQVVDSHVMAPHEGTVVEVHDNGDAEPTYTVRHVDNVPDFDRFGESELEPDTTGFLDLGDIAQVRQELVESIADDQYAKYVGLTAESRSERIRSASRIAFLASRLAWLESVELDRELMRPSK